MPDRDPSTVPPHGFPAHAVAIVGFTGRFPGARDLEEFWQNVRNGVETLQPFSDEQLEAIRLSTSEALTNVVLHAYPAQMGHVHLTVRLAGGELWVLIADKGK